MESLKKRLTELANGDSSSSAANDPYGVFRLSEEELERCEKQAKLLSDLVRSSHQSQGQKIHLPACMLPILS